MQKLIVRLTLRLLRSKRLTGENRGRVIAALLNNLKAIPIRDVISFDTQGTLSIQGRQLELEQAMVFRDSVKALRDSYARNLIHEQLTYEAIKLGVYTGINTEMIEFSKAALWILQEENKLIEQLTEIN